MNVINWLNKKKVKQNRNEITKFYNEISKGMFGIYFTETNSNENVQRKSVLL